MDRKGRLADLRWYVRLQESERRTSEKDIKEVRVSSRGYKRLAGK